MRTLSAAVVMLVLAACSGGPSPRAAATTPPGSGGGGTVVPASAQSPLLAGYRTSSEGASIDIEIAGGTLSVTSVDPNAPGCGQSVAQQPCYSASDLRTQTAPLSAAELDDLARTIRQSGFPSLGPAYGGAAAGQRYYPETLTVTIDGVHNQVVYQSFPGATDEPPAFATVRKALFNLAHAKTGLSF